MQPQSCHFQAKERDRDHDGRLGDNVFDAHMPSFSSIPDPVAWANNAIQERRQAYFPITPAKCGDPVGGQSNLTHLARLCLKDERRPTPFGRVTRLAPDRSQSLVCCPTVNPTVPYALDSTVRPHPAKKDPCNATLCPYSNLENDHRTKRWSCDQERR